MAFTEAQNVQIRATLGYGAVFRAYDPRLENALLTVGNLPETQTEAESILADIASVKTALANNLLGAGILSADEVSWSPTRRGNNSTGSTFLDGIRAEGRRHCGRLSTLFCVPLASDYFGEGGYAGDEYFSRQNQQGRLVPLG